MASYGSGFASGMEAGGRLGERLLKAYEWGEKRRLEEGASEAAKVDQEKVETTQVDTGLKGMTGSLDEMDMPTQTQTQWKLGNKTQDKQFSNDEVYRHRMGNVADYYASKGKLDEAGKYRGLMRQDELTGLQIKGEGLRLKSAERAEDYAAKEEEFMKFMQGAQGLTDEQFYPALAAFATRFVPDGNSFGVSFDENEGWRGTMTSADGRAQSMGIKDREQASRMIEEYISPTFRKNVQERRDKDRTYDLNVRKADSEARYRDRAAAVAEENARTLGDYRRTLGNAANKRSGYERLPEGVKLVLGNTGRALQGLEVALTKLDPADPSYQQQAGAIKSRMMQLRTREYDLLSKHGVLDEDTPKWQYLGLPEPKLMLGESLRAAKTQQEFDSSLSQFESVYGNGEDTAELINAARAEAAQRFSRVRPQGVGGEGPRYNAGAYGLGRTVGGAVADQFSTDKWEELKRWGRVVGDFGRGLVGPR